MASPIVQKALFITIAEAGKRHQLSEDVINTPFFEVWANSANLSNVFVGDDEVDNTHIPRASNSITAYGASTRGDLAMGDWFDLSQYFVDAASDGDKVVVQYFARGS